MNAPNNTAWFKTLLKPGIQKKFLYTPIAKVKTELEKRQQNSLGTDVIEAIKPTPELQFLLEQPHLVFFRQVATPLHETMCVINMAKELEMPLCIFEYHQDLFVGAGNPYKLSLGKLPIYQFTNRNDADIYKNCTTVDFNAMVGKPLAEVLTKHGQSLISFHQELFENSIKECNVEIKVVDASNWFKQFSHNAEEYYDAFLALFIEHNLLAEIFLSQDKHEKRLTTEVVIPAFNKQKTRFGRKPLVVNYLPKKEQTRTFWDCYPNSVSEFLSEKGYSI